MADRVSKDLPQGNSPRYALPLARFSLIVAILIAYAPLFQADFSNWDDTFNVAENPRLNPPTWQSISYYWQHEAYDLYIPVTYTAWAVLAKFGYVSQPDSSGWHLNPYVFHAANIFIHIGSALLVFSILRKIVNRSVAAAWIGAMVFALHPTQVESVGWVAGLKDVLAGMLALAALRLYLEDGPPKRQAICFALAIVSLLLAMLSKPIAMVVPVMAAAIDLILQRRSLRQIVIRFAAWIPLSLLCAIIAKHSQPARYSQVLVSPFLRPLIAGDSLTFYLWKIIWPIHLGIDYGRSPRTVTTPGVEYLTALVPIALAILLWIKRREWKLPLAAAAIFLIGLSPVLGLIPFDFQIYSTVADHYLYLPMLGLAVAVMCIILAWPKRATMIASGVILLLLGTKTFLQSFVWANSTSLFSHALAVNPRSWAAIENLAQVTLSTGDMKGAEQQVRLALQINPDYGEGYAALARILQLSGDLPGAIGAAKQATSVEPKDTICWTQLGHAYSAAGQHAEAIDAYRHAAQLDPRDPKALINLASALAESGNLAEAITLYGAAVKINPASPEAQEGLSRATEALKTRASSPATRGEH